MTKHTKKLPLKIIAYAAFLLFAYILQAAVFSNLTIRGAKPVILPLVVVCAAMFEGCSGGGLLGLAAGMLCDISYNQPTIQFTLVLTLIGILIGFLTDTVFAKGFPTYLLWGILSVVASIITQTFGLVVFHDVDFRYIVHPAVFQCLYSMIFLLPVYIAVRRISRISVSY